jgi:hypothetical protein
MSAYFALPNASPRKRPTDPKRANAANPYEFPSVSPRTAFFLGIFGNGEVATAREARPAIIATICFP